MSRVYKHRALAPRSMLVVLLAVAAPVPKFIVYSECALKASSVGYCPLLVGSGAGDAYCCNDRTVPARAAPLGAFCVGLAEGITQCDAIVTGSSAWCCADPWKFRSGIGAVFNDVDYNQWGSVYEEVDYDEVSEVVDDEDIENWLWGDDNSNIDLPWAHFR